MSDFTVGEVVYVLNTHGGVPMGFGRIVGPGHPGGATARTFQLHVEALTDLCVLTGIATVRVIHPKGTVKWFNPTELEKTRAIKPMPSWAGTLEQLRSYGGTTPAPPNPAG